jgi:hypothetical protein
VNVANIGNSFLDYEKRINMQIGLEAGLLNNKIWVDASYFKERYTDQITKLTSSTPSYLGGFLPYVNYGEDRYSGVELGLSLRNKINKISYELGGSFTYLSSEAVLVDEEWQNDYQYRKGKRTDGVWALEADGLFATEDEITNSTPQAFGSVKPGDIRYVDQNNDGIIDANDAVLIGNSRPDYTAGMHLRVSYGKLSFFALATGSFGYTSFTNDSYYWVYGDRKYSEIVLNRWNPADADHSASTYPRLSSISSSNNFRNSTFWIYDNSRISISRMQLTYDFKSLASKFSANNLAVYLRADNMLMFAKNKDKIQLNHNTEPQYTTYSVGVRANF